MIDGYDHPTDFVDDDEVAETFQSTIDEIASRSNLTIARTNLATVNVVYADRNTCDVTTWNNTKAYNVPLLSKTYLVSDEIYGELELPPVGSVVLIAFIAGRESQPYILGTVVPYLYGKYQTDQVAINSGSKAYTKKLYEAGKEKYYRKIFQGGTTIEVDDSGTITVETPSGTYIRAVESGTKMIKLQDAFGNIFILDTNGVSITAKGGTTIVMTGSTTTINGQLEVTK